PGTYTVEVSNGGICSVISLPFVLAELPSPAPVITGGGFLCGGDPVVLSTTEDYESYFWSTASYDPTISVGTGSYIVMVTNEFGCTGTSAPYPVTSGSDPNAAFTTDPVSPQGIGTTVNFIDESTISGGQIVSWDWTFGGLGTSTDG